VKSGASPVAIVGAGPTGIACAVSLGREGIDAVCYDKGSILESIFRFPEEMRWFSTRDLLEIAGVPFAIADAHPNRLDTLAYYRGVAEKFGVRVEPETEVHSIRPEADRLTIGLIRAGAESRVSAPAAIVATGFFHNPRRLDVPGEGLPVVRVRYVSGYPFHGRRVIVVGSRNSAAEAALDLYRHGARVTLVARAPAISDRVKYWIRPDIENRIRAGAIRALFHARIREIRPDGALVATPRGEEFLPADAVFTLVGYEPDFAMLERCGIELEGPSKAPSHDIETLESNVPNVYVAGAVLSGLETGKIFIENSRHHADQIAAAIARRLRAVHA
jgi:thioredoxin reductase (NADPH)